MNQERTSMKQVFGDILSYFAFSDIKKNLKIGLSLVGKMYIICPLLIYVHTCLSRPSISHYFEMDLPSIIV